MDMVLVAKYIFISESNVKKAGERWMKPLLEHSIPARCDRLAFPCCHVLAKIYDESSRLKLFGVGKRRA